MKKIITNIILMMIILLGCSISVFAAEQLQATIEITPSVTEVVEGDKVVFTFVTKNITNAEYGKIYAIEGNIQYDKTFFELEAGGMDVGDTGKFVSMTPVGEGGTNGTITLKVINNPTGSGVVKFTELSAGDGRIEDSETLGIAKTANQEFTITLKDEGENETPCEHTYGNYTDNGDGTHSSTCTKCGEKRTEQHTYEDGNCSECNAKEPITECEHAYGNYADNGDGTHSSTCTKCGEKRTEQHTYESGICSECGAREPITECEHTYGNYTDNGDGTHSSTCTKCGEKRTEQHTYESGICSGCEAKELTDEDNKKDETTADGKIPQAGVNTLLTFGILIIAILAVIMYRKNQKYKDIK